MKTLLLFTAVTLVSSGHAQSFKETVSWMHHASEYNTLRMQDDNTLDSTDVPLENTCKNFVVNQRHTGKYIGVFTVTLDLGTLDPTRTKLNLVKGKPWAYVEINTRNDEERIRVQRTVDGKVFDDPRTAGVSLSFKSDFAPRFAKALRHAVELCGGKPSTF